MSCWWCLLLKSITICSHLLSWQSALTFVQGGREDESSLDHGPSSSSWALHIDFCNCVCVHVCVKSGVLSGWLRNPPALFTNTHWADKAERSTKSLWASWKGWECLLFDSVKAEMVIKWFDYTPDVLYWVKSFMTWMVSSWRNKTRQDVCGLKKKFSSSSSGSFYSSYQCICRNDGWSLREGGNMLIWVLLFHHASDLCTLICN